MASGLFQRMHKGGEHKGLVTACVTHIPLTQRMQRMDYEFKEMPELKTFSDGRDRDMTSLHSFMVGDSTHKTHFRNDHWVIPSGTREHSKKELILSTHFPLPFAQVIVRRGSLFSPSVFSFRCSPQPLIENISSPICFVAYLQT